MRRYRFLALLAAMCLFLTGCSGQTAPDAASAPEPGSFGVQAEASAQGEGPGGLPGEAGGVALLCGAAPAELLSALDGALAAAGIGFSQIPSDSREAQLQDARNAVQRGAPLLVVCLTEAGDQEAAADLLDMAGEAGIPVVFFFSPVSREADEGRALLSAQGALLVTMDEAEANRAQGEMIGRFLLADYDRLDRNGDGTISYVLLRDGPEGQSSPETADGLLAEGGRAPLSYFDAASPEKYLDVSSAGEAQAELAAVLSQFREEDGNLTELVIAGSDALALGAVAALRSAGYNDGAGTAVPVFGIGGSAEVQEAVASGAMAGVVTPDTAVMADAVAQIAGNLLAGRDALEGVAGGTENWRVTVPCTEYPAP